MAVDWLKIQDKWQNKWLEAELGKATVQKNKEKFMIIFAYPGISGFPHIGHMRGFSYTDIIARYKRMQGKEVLFPVGTHASGNHAFAFAKKIRNNDQKWIEYLLTNGCPPEKLKELTEPEKIIEYFNGVYVNDYFKKFGFICDWDRFICTTHKDYEKFIQWQFLKLQQKDLLVQKPYFATACVNCGPVAVDPSETDISKGGHAEKQEYTLLKFKLGNDYLVAATLRPETIFGQTNLWINPDAEYVRIEVNSANEKNGRTENWIISKEAADKLKYQKEEIILKETVDVKKFLGKEALAPGIEREIIILPAEFCDPKFGTGIVTSVPSDAPYDYVALRTIQRNEALLKKYFAHSEKTIEKIRELKLISIIDSKGYGNFPAQEIVEKLSIHNLSETEKLEEATKEIYKVGFHTGTMKENCGKYAGMKVEEAKELMKAELLENNQADIFYDLTEEVICRCGGKVIIKKIDDQWFIKYSDQELTERSKEQAKEMKIYPKEFYDNLPAILDWFNDRACARLGSWMGSKLPFDNSWVIEPISDSTLYPAYYIVAKFFNNGKLKLNDLTEEFFDYVYLGKQPNLQNGKSDKKEKNIDEKTLAVWKEVREEFDYFYPLDLNLGGKEHQTVHFPVFLMNHVAILPEDKWPQGIFVNWWVTGEGNKISKSKGGAVPIPQAMEKYGVDAMRLYYAHIGSPHVDVVWTESVVLNYKNNLEKIAVLFESIKEMNGQGKLISGKKKAIDLWLSSRVQEALRRIKEVMNNYDFREFGSLVYFQIYDDFRWYLRRGGCNKATIESLLDVWIKLMNPITPHLSEELNELMNLQNNSGQAHNQQHKKLNLVSAAEWPQFNEEEINLKAEAGEQLIKNMLEDMRYVLKLAKLEHAKKCTVFIAEKWLYELFGIVSKEIKVTRNVGEIMKKVLAEEKLNSKGKEISRIVISLLKDVSKIPHLVTSQEEELNVIWEAKEFLKKEFECEVEIVVAEGSEHQKAKSALPGKVGILVE